MQFPLSDQNHTCVDKTYFCRKHFYTKICGKWNSDKCLKKETTSSLPFTKKQASKQKSQTESMFF